MLVFCRVIVLFVPLALLPVRILLSHEDFQPQKGTKVTRDRTAESTFPFLLRVLRLFAASLRCLRLRLCRTVRFGGDSVLFVPHLSL